MRQRWMGRSGALVLGALIGGFALAGAASAHVTVNPDSAPRGGYTRIAFRVPTESDTLSTTKLQVFFDVDHPVASVSTMPVPGFSATVATATLAKPLTDDDGNQVTRAVSEITWTANSPSSAIRPGEFDEFPVSLGPLPDVASLTFKVLQTYSDGSIVRWIDVSTPGAAEPDHPAPVLTLTAAGGASTAPTPSAGGTVVVTSAAKGGSNGGALTLGIIGALLGLVGAVLGGAAYARTRGASS